MVKSGVAVAGISAHHYRAAGLANTAHIEGGIDAWKKAGGPVVMG